MSAVGPSDLNGPSGLNGPTSSATGHSDPKKVAAARKKLEEYKVKKKANPKKDDKIDNNLLANTDKIVVDSNSSTVSPIDNVRSVDNTSEAKHSFDPVSTNVNSLYINAPSSANFFDQLQNDADYQNKLNRTDENIPPVNTFFNSQNSFENSTVLDSQNYSDCDSRQNRAVTNYESVPVNSSDKFHDGNDDYDNDSIDEALSSSAVLKLQQQLQFHMQTVEFLVSEKQNLCSKVNELENVISDVKNQNIDLSGRLNISRQRASSLEVDYSSLKQKYEDVNNKLQHALTDNNKHKSFESSHEKTISDLKEELAESKALVNIKLSENTNYLKQIEELTFRLNATELRFQQLHQGNLPQNKDQALVNENIELKQQITNLNLEMKGLEVEKNQSNSQYQNYVQQLNSQLELMNRKHEELVSANENLLNRESNLIQQMEVLEKQLQSTVHVVPTVEVNKVSNEDLAELNSQMKSVEERNALLMGELEKKDAALQSALSEMNVNKAQIDELTNTISLLKSEQPDIVKLNAANESDRIAAQKATIQNTKLKSDIESLQEAYNKMTESKLELAERLQTEKNMSKKLMLAFADHEEQLRSTYSKLAAKDEEMLRLQAESSVLEKEALKNAQIIDRLNHYEVQNQSSDLLQKELEISLAKVKSLSDENNKLKSAIKTSILNHVENGLDSSDSKTLTNNANIISSENVIEIENTNANKKEEQNKMSVSDGCLHIPTTEAMKKLQERFTKLMDDVANLSDDKQRLEHLVLQLQGETETICEYITLYQKQRSILKQREYEKDIQLRLLSQERLQVQEQLSKLNILVQQLVKEKNAQEVAAEPVDGVKIENVDTADKIINLLTEIKSNHLSEPTNSYDYLENFHPCPWCSGKMITI